MPYGVPIFWLSSLLLFNCCRFLLRALRNNLIGGGGGGGGGGDDVIVVTILPFSGKERKRMAVPYPSSCVFYHFTRKYDDSERHDTWDNG